MRFGVKHYAAVFFALVLAGGVAFAAEDAEATPGGEPAAAEELSTSIADVQQVRERINARRAEILVENEEAGKLDAERKELEKAYLERAAALDKIYASDEKLAELEKVMDKMFEDIRKVQRAAAIERMKQRVAAGREASASATETAPEKAAE